MGRVNEGVHGLNLTAPDTPHPLLLHVDPAAATYIVENCSSFHPSSLRVKRLSPFGDFVSVECGPSHVDYLAGLDGVESVSLDQKMMIMDMTHTAQDLIPAWAYPDPFRHFNYNFVGTTKIYDLLIDHPTDLTGEAIKIGIVDTGQPIPVHPQLYGSGAQIDGESVIGEITSIDFHSHATWITTTGVSRPYSGLLGDCRGMVPKAQMITVKALDYNGLGLMSDVISGIQLAVNKGAKIINLSLGTPTLLGGPENPLYIATKAIADLGVIFMCAAGNSGPLPFTISYPAGFGHVIAVGALDFTHLAPAFYSSRGPDPYFRNVKPDCVCIGGGAPNVGDKWDVIYSGTEGLTDGEFSGFKTFTDGDLGCVGGDSVISTEFGGKYLEDLNIGERVFSFDSYGLNLQPIVAVQKKKPQPAAILKTTTREVTATFNHPFLCLCKDRVVPESMMMQMRSLWQMGLKTNEIGKLLNVPPHRVHQISYNGYRSSKYVYHLRWLTLGQIRKMWSKSVYNDVLLVTPKKMPQRQPDGCIGVSLARWLGYFLGDGWLSTTGVNLANDGDPKKGAFYVELGSKIWKKPFKPYFHKGRLNCWHFYSRKTENQLRNWGFDKPAKEKVVPSWILHLPANEREAFAQGYLDADGSRTKDGMFWYFECSSRELMKGMWHLFYELGYSVSRVYGRVRTVQPPGSRQPIRVETHGFTVSVTHQRPYNCWDVVKQDLSHLFDKQYLGLQRVKEIKECGEQALYDITVEGTHNFVAEGLMSHNTSMATPQVGYLIALWMQAGKVSKTSDVMQIFAQNGQSKDNIVGYGLPKLSWAV